MGGQVVPGRSSHRVTKVIEDNQCCEGSGDSRRLTKVDVGRSNSLPTLLHTWKSQTRRMRGDRASVRINPNCAVFDRAKAAGSGYILNRRCR